MDDDQTNLFGNPAWAKAIRAAKGQSAQCPRPTLTAAQRRKRKEELPENLVEAQVKSYLQSRGWMLTRNHVGKFVPVGMLLGLLGKGAVLTKENVCRWIIAVNENGMADWKAERPLRGAGIPFAAVQQFYFETKAPGDVPKPHQFDWLRIRAQLGFSAAWFDRFDAIPLGKGQPFLPWYIERFKE